jgi:phage/plasmid primase-like uncharacterized protein
MAQLQRFTEFVKDHAGSNYLSIADYFDSDIQALANECNIDWSGSKFKIIWDGAKNGSKDRKSYVQGLTPDDKSRVYIFADYKTYEKDGESFTYPVISFQNMRQSLGKPNRQFNALFPLFEKYNEYKSTRKTPVKNTAKVSDEACQQREAVAKEKNDRILQQQRKVQAREPKTFARMLSLQHPKAFSPYLQNEKHLGDVAKRFDIRISKDKHGYFTCFALTTVTGEFCGLQRIYHNTPDGWDDRKRNTWGVDTTGLCAILGELSADTEMVYLCEGLATGLAMHKATGRTIIVCLYAGNIKHVSGEIAATFPAVKRVHVADNDNAKPEFGNTGVYECALAVQQHGGHVFVPVVENGNDVCDLYNGQGLDALKQQIYASPCQYFNGRVSASVAGIFNYIHDRYIPSSQAA